MKKEKKVLYSDTGVVIKKYDNVSIGVSVVCAILSVVLIVLGVLALFAV